ncbi:MAG: pyridoxamine 5'-phosphate oxidase family protein [Chloroflexi bacterium]|nr:pyridoxamine 5'-phosphate oxidase family protein [Chloroflexota bacterium]
MMRILAPAAALALLDELSVLRIAGFDQARSASYAVPLAFVRREQSLLIAIRATGRLAQLLQLQPQGWCIEADQINPDWTFRSVVAQASAQPLAEPQIALVALAERYGRNWPQWRPNAPIQAFSLELAAIQGRHKS